MASRDPKSADLFGNGSQYRAMQAKFAGSDRYGHRIYDQCLTSSPGKLQKYPGIGPQLFYLPPKTTSLTYIQIILTVSSGESWNVEMGALSEPIRRKRPFCSNDPTSIRPPICWGSGLLLRYRARQRTGLVKLSSAVSDLPWAVCVSPGLADDEATSKRMVGEPDGSNVASLKAVVTISFPAVTSP